MHNSTVLDTIINYIIKEAIDPLKEVANILLSKKTVLAEKKIDGETVLTDEAARRIANDERVALCKDEAKERLSSLERRVQMKEEEVKGD